MLRDNSGASLLEWALLLACIAVVCATCIYCIGHDTGKMLSIAGKSL
jgi:Flp pilus assembly pilin Flp